MQERRRRTHIVVPHKVLLVEVERYCHETGCKALTRIGLTKDEARDYHGFECNFCGKWNNDILTEHDVPDWWEELKSGESRSHESGESGESNKFSDSPDSRP